MQLRVLGAGDEAAFEAFLSSHRDTSMFLRSNARKAGLVYAGERYQATYVGAFIKEQMVGVAAHSWNGMLLLRAPQHVDEVAREAVASSQRRVTGLLGPLDQVRRARRALELDGAATTLDEDEAFYTLDLADLIVPTALAEGALTCRPPLAAERDTLCAWRHGYNVEVLGATDDDATRQSAAALLDAQIADGNAWVAVHHGEPVSLSAFNAALPDIVQLGGIYTPPSLRGRGYAKAAVAGSLQAALSRGASRAVLFTSNPSAAQSYEAVGFRRAGDYGLILFR